MVLGAGDRTRTDLCCLLLSPLARPFAEVGDSLPSGGPSWLPNEPQYARRLL